MSLAANINETVFDNIKAEYETNNQNDTNNIYSGNGDDAKNEFDNNGQNMSQEFDSKQDNSQYDENNQDNNDQLGNDENGNGNDDPNANYDNGDGNNDQMNDENNQNDDSQSNPMEPEQFRKVFIGGLSYKTDDETLKNYFAKYGELVDYVVMKDGQTGRSRGFGFVTYSFSSMVDELMKNRPHIIDGRQVEPKRATPREDSGKQEVQMTVKKLFIGGLRDNLTEDDLKNYFNNYGNVIEAVVMKEKETSKSRGFGFVTFDDYDPVDKIILEKHHTINGINVHTQKALPKDFEKGQGGGGNNNNNNNRQQNFRNNNNNNNNDNFNANNFNGNNFNAGNFNNNNNFNKGGFKGGNFRNNNNNNNGYQNNGGNNNSSLNNTYGSYNQANKPKMNNDNNMMGNNNNNMNMNRNKNGGGPMRGGHGRFTNRSQGPYGGGSGGFNNGNNNNFNNNRGRGRGIGQRGASQRENNNNNSNSNMNNNMNNNMSNNNMNN